MIENDFSSRISALVDQGRQGEALAYARRCAASQHPDALHMLASWHIIGSAVPRDLPLARRLLACAATAGHADAIRTLSAMLANGSGGAVDWPGACALLRRQEASDLQATRELQLIDAMAITLDGDPSVPIIAKPMDAERVVCRFPSLLSTAECDHIVAETRDYLAPAMVFDSATGRQIRNPIRTSDAMVVSPIRESLVLRAISLRLAAASATDVNQGEATSVMRYRQGQEFKLHLDSLDGTSNQRIKTMLVYLNDDFEGGETVFPHLDLAVRPSRGDAILFDNVRDGKKLGITQHAGLAVSLGEKWLLSKWIRERPFSQWKGPEQALRQN